MYFYIITDIYKGGELYDVLTADGFPEGYVAVLMKQLLSCINYCHKQQHLVHRDLKPGKENVIASFMPEHFVTPTLTTPTLLYF